VKYPAYPKYKSSGVEWLSDVPEHWDVVPLKQVTNFVNGMAFKPDDWSAEGVPIIRIENLNGGVDFNGFEGEVAHRYHITKGDLLFGWSGNRGTSFGPFLWWRDGTHYLNQHIFKLIGFACEKAWFYWTLKAVTRTIEDEAHGIIGMVHVTRGRLGAIKIPMIPYLEQRAIAKFLNAKMGGLDNLVTRKLALIEKLKEKRTALISRTVRRGLSPEAARAASLDPHPKLKPSGIEWLGDTPEHWTEGLLGRFFRLQRGFDIVGAAEIDEGFPVISSGGISGRTDSPMCRAPGVVIGRKGTLGTVHYSFSDYWPHDTTLWIKEFNGSHPRFCYYYLIHLRLERLDNGAANPTLNRNYVHPIRVAFPPGAEQRAIADFLDRETTKIDRMVEKVEAAIERLQEYRSALITAAVTGKIDVRSIGE
jgi:type I restriction enzyme, S subunit